MAKENWILAIASLATAVLVTLLGKGLLKLIPIFCGIVVGFVLAFILGAIDFTQVVNAPWFELPKFITPEFSWGAIFFMAPVAIAPIIEHVGNVYAVNDVAGKDFVKDPGLHRTMLGDGLACMVAGTLGGPPVTTYSEVIGAMSLTKITSPSVIRIAAVTGITSFFQSIARNIATQGIKEYVMNSVSNMVQSITNSISSVQSGSIISEFGTYVSENFMQVLNKSVSVGNKVANFWMEKRAEKQAKIITSNGAILDKQSEELAKFTDKEYNIGLEDLKLYTKPLTVDNIQYEVDYLYEPSKYNICRPSFITPSLNIRSTKVGK